MTKRSPLALAVLALLAENPMHPYRMQRLITSRGKSEVINVTARASLYNTIDRLARDGLVQLMETTREGQRPERSVYEITDAGRAAAGVWLREMICAPKPEYPEFPAAVAHLPLLEPAQAADYLRLRAAGITAEIGRISAELDAAKDRLPRLFLLDTELSLDIRRTELRWIESVLADLHSGAMDWSRESLAVLARTLEKPGEHPDPEEHTS